jgi:hypothetical protein
VFFELESGEYVWTLNLERVKRGIFMLAFAARKKPNGISSVNDASCSNFTGIRFVA